jgi:hypothetical protein
MGDTYTISDPYLFTIASWSKPTVWIQALPKVLDRNRMAERSAVKGLARRQLSISPRVAANGRPSALSILLLP